MLVPEPASELQCLPTTLSASSYQPISFYASTYSDTAQWWPLLSPRCWSTLYSRPQPPMPLCLLPPMPLSRAYQPWRCPTVHACQCCISVRAWPMPMPWPLSLEAIPWPVSLVAIPCFRLTLAHVAPIATLSFSLSLPRSLAPSFSPSLLRSHSVARASLVGMHTQMHVALALILSWPLSLCLAWPRSLSLSVSVSLSFSLGVRSPNSAVA